MIKKLKQMLLLNECGGDETIPYQFSDADGVRTGRSGYSFGVSQFDIENNWTGILLLEEIGFTPKELKRLFLQDSNIYDLNEKLSHHMQSIDFADSDHIFEMIEHCWSLFPHCADLELAMLVDYHNQFYLSNNGKLHTYLKDLPSWNALTIFEFKKTTLWGRRRPDDVERRYKNTLEVFG